MVVDKPGEGLWFLVRTGLAEEFLPELPALALEQDPIHRHKDVLAHTIAVVENTRPVRLLRLAALFHDVGKPKTRSFGPRGTVMFHHHEVVGARMTRDRMKALRYSQRRHRDRQSARRPPPALPHLPDGLDGQRRPPLRPRRRTAPGAAQRADPLRLHHPQRGQGPGPGPTHGRARGPHRRAAGPGGAGGHPSGPGRQPGHDPAGVEAGPGGGRGPVVAARAAARGRTARRGGGGPPPRRLVGGACRHPERWRPADAAP